MARPRTVHQPSCDSGCILLSQTLPLGIKGKISLLHPNHSFSLVFHLISFQSFESVIQPKQFVHPERKTNFMLPFSHQLWHCDRKTPPLKIGRYTCSSIYRNSISCYNWQLNFHACFSSNFPQHKEITYLQEHEKGGPHLTDEFTHFFPLLDRANQFKVLPPPACLTCFLCRCTVQLINSNKRTAMLRRIEQKIRDRVYREGEKGEPQVA